MLNPIFKNKSYQFDITIKVNGIPTDITADAVTVMIDKSVNVDTPKLLKNADVSGGTEGLAVFEFTPAETTVLESGNNIIQIVWELVGGERKFIVYDDQIKIKPVIK